MAELRGLHEDLGQLDDLVFLRLEAAIRLLDFVVGLVDRQDDASMALFVIEDRVREKSSVKDSHHDFGQLVS